MNFDPTLTIGAVLNLVGFIIGGLAFALTLRGDLRALVARVSRLEISNDVMARAMTTLAVQDERLTMHGRRIEALETQMRGR